jgi:rRNA maturation protein Nop10
MSKTQPICDHCGGTNVFADAYAQYDTTIGDWSIVTVFDNHDCQDCGGQTKIRWANIPAEVSNENSNA